jgi:hypothetical protein
VTQLKTPVNPTGGGNRTQGGTQLPAAPVGAAQDPIEKWMGVANGDVPTTDEANDILSELKTIASSATGARKATAYFIMGQASYKLDKSDDACLYWQRAVDLKAGKFSGLASTWREQASCK